MLTSHYISNNKLSKHHYLVCMGLKTNSSWTIPNLTRILGINVCPRYENKVCITDKDLLQLSHLDHSLFTILGFISSLLDCEITELLWLKCTNSSKKLDVLKSIIWLDVTGVFFHRGYRAVMGSLVEGLAYLPALSFRMCSGRSQTPGLALWIVCKTVKVSDWI